jgi:hypothetical protein
MEAWMAKKSAEKEKPEPKKKEDKKKGPEKAKKASGQSVPFFLETTFAVSQAIVAMTGILVVVSSILAGVSAIWVLVRTAAAILVVGMILWFLNWLIAKGTFDAEVARLKEEEENSTTMEVKA